MKATRICDRMLSCHDSLSRLFGERFSTLVAEPIKVLAIVMKHKGLGAIEATLLLCEAAVEQDPLGSAAHVMWLCAACVELVEGTPLRSPHAPREEPMTDPRLTSIGSSRGA